VESNPQDTTKEPVVIPRIEDNMVRYTEGEGSEEPQLSTSMQDDGIDIPDEELEGTYLEDIEMSEATTQSDLPMDVSIPDQIKNIVAPPPVPVATRIPSWKRELTASTVERERAQTSYSLRAKPAKKSLFY
jgi:hypothetical protein